MEAIGGMSSDAGSRSGDPAVTLNHAILDLKIIN